jgi:CheY-like chemotaxis protein
LSGRSILVIEGEDSFRELLKNILEQEGYLVYATGDGEEALEMARRSAHTWLSWASCSPGWTALQFAAF